MVADGAAIVGAISRDRCEHLVQLATRAAGENHHALLPQRLHVVGFIGCRLFLVFRLGFWFFSLFLLSLGCLVFRLLVFRLFSLGLRYLRSGILRILHLGSFLFISSLAHCRRLLESHPCRTDSAACHSSRASSSPTRYPHWRPP